MRGLPRSLDPRPSEARAPFRRESPERAQPSLVGAWGTSNPYPLRFPLGERSGRPEQVVGHPDAESGRPYEFGVLGRINRVRLVSQTVAAESSMRKAPAAIWS